jgi:hypothetical protein
VLNSAELYDPASDSWSDAGTLVTQRYDHTANLLASGDVLITAGYLGRTLSDTELYIADRIFADNFDGTPTKYQ